MRSVTSQRYNDILMPPPRMEKETVAETGAVRERYVEDTPLLINIKGCGYPPNIICDDYAETYENFSRVGENIF